MSADTQRGEREPTAEELAHVYAFIRRLTGRELFGVRFVLNRSGQVAAIPEGHAVAPGDLENPSGRS